MFCAGADVGWLSKTIDYTEDENLRDAGAMSRMFAADDLDVMQLVRCAFDPTGVCNPGKVFPTPRLCGEVPGRHKGPHPLQEAGLAEVF